MKAIYLLLLYFCLIQAPRADDAPIKVAIYPLNPPFVMEGAYNQYYGYDISMMQYICKTIQRSCQYIPLTFDKLLNAVKSKEADIAVSSITITKERAEIVNFSLPYLLSHACFIGSKKYATKPFTLNILNGRKIGITEGSIFTDAIQQMKITNPIIITYTKLNYLIDDLYNGKIEFALLDEPSALYWQTQSANKLRVLGKSFNYGIGLGIAVNRDNSILLQTINNALLKYQDSNDFKINYNTYMTQFKMEK